jgi:hypothetical protein
VHLAIEVRAELVAVDDAAVLRLQLLAVETDEECAHIVEKFVYPGEVD